MEGFGNGRMADTTQQDSHKQAIRDDQDQQVLDGYSRLKEGHWDRKKYERVDRINFLLGMDIFPRYDLGVSQQRNQQ